MIYCMYISSISLSFLITNILFFRLRSTNADLAQFLLPRPRQPFLTALFTCISQWSDDSILASLDGNGIAGCELRFREAHDSYRTVGHLLEYVNNEARSHTELPFDALIKATYQLAFTLDIPLDRLDACLDILIKAMQVNSVHAIVRVQKISPGDLVDTVTMVQLDYGQRVLYPMGCIAYGSGNQVIHRGRVICR